MNQLLIIASRPQQIGMNGSITLKNNRMPITNGLKIKTNDSIEDGLNEFKLNIILSILGIFGEYTFFGKLIRFSF